MDTQITRIPVQPTRSPRLVPKQGKWLGEIKAADVLVGDIVCHQRMEVEDVAVDEQGKPFVPAWECLVLDATTSGSYRPLMFRALEAPAGDPVHTVYLRLDEPVLLVDGPVADQARDAVPLSMLAEGSGA